MEGDRARRRPTHRGGRPVLTREAIARAALALVAREGHRDLTMRSLAAELGVTPKAVYHHVEDRRDVLLAALTLAEADWPVPDPEAASWEDELRAMLHAVRAWYRAHPSLLLLVREEDMTAEVHPNPLVANEAAFRLLRRAGLGPTDVVRTWSAWLLAVYGFATFQDGATDDPPEGVAYDWDVVPDHLLDAHPDLDLSTTRELAARAGRSDSDALFAALVDILLAGAHALRPGDGLGDGGAV